jgi:MoxR-like ATPase
MPGRYDPELARRIAWGASPRGSIALERCARARAWLAGRDFVTARGHPRDRAGRAAPPRAAQLRGHGRRAGMASGWCGPAGIVPLP